MTSLAIARTSISFVICVGKSGTHIFNTNGEVRMYKVWGKARLDDADEMWTCPTNGTHRFFKVSVEMK